MEWQNYGDGAPIEYGGIFIKKDSEGCYYVVAFNKAPDADVWLLSDMYVDLSDDWYEWDSVNLFADISDHEDDVYKVIALTQYYGSTEFGHEEVVEGEDSLRTKLADYGIEVE